MTQVPTVVTLIVGMVLGVMFGQELRITREGASSIVEDPKTMVHVEDDADHAFVPMPGLRVVVHFEDEPAWEGWRKRLDLFDETAGFQLDLTDGCHVYLRASRWAITAVPREGRAEFIGADGQTMAELFGHEVLHCLADRWHRDWRLIGLDRLVRQKF